ncbi:MAG: hypothetical protein KKE50_01725 [Nanoarchaeota archaeon]|nr:hypothetical protein [Nanoarchaeota archaeon]
MKIKKLNPQEIMTTKDFPVHNPHILKIYFKICKEKVEEILPPTPVIPFSIGLPLLADKNKESEMYNKRIKEYVKSNPEVKYLMVDGSHKTTALTLTHKKIHAIILETDKDIKEVKELMKTGEIFGINKINPIKKELKLLAKHFKDAKFFESVEDKTKRMVKKKVIPKYMIDYYKGK